jgi:hypothetical protein
VVFPANQLVTPYWKVCHDVVRNSQEKGMALPDVAVGRNEDSVHELNSLYIQSHEQIGDWTHRDKEGLITVPSRNMCIEGGPSPSRPSFIEATASMRQEQPALLMQNEIVLRILHLP